MTGRGAAHHAAPSTSRRALRSRYIDLIRDGVSSQNMRREGRDRAVYNGLYRTALAAINAGWTFPEWHAEVSKRGSILAAQAASKRNGQDRPQREVEKTLRTAWTRAAAQAEQSPAAGFTPQERRARVAAVRTWLADPNCPAAENVRLVVDAVARRCAELSVTQTACSRSYLLDTTGLGLTALRTALKHALSEGLLIVTQWGRRGTTTQPRSGVATSYLLPHPENLPALRPVDALTSAGKPASRASEWGPARTSSAPAPRPKPPVIPAVAQTAPAHPSHKDDPMITISVSGRDAEALTARLAELLAGTGMRVEAETVPHLSVIPGGAPSGRPTQQRVAP